MPSLVFNLNFSKLLHNKKAFLIISVILFLCTLIVGIVGSFSYRNDYIAIPPSAPHVPSQLGVTYRENNAPHQLDEKRRMELEERLLELGVVSQEKMFIEESGVLSQYYELSLREGTDIVNLQEELGKFKEIKLSEPNFIVEVFAEPNDRLYGLLWGMDQINMPETWDMVTNASAITVAVIDSGIRSSHPDLSSSIVTGQNFLLDNIDDDLGHGSHVAGIIGAVGNNEIGVAGVAWNVRIMPLRVCKSTGLPSRSSECNIFNIAKAINYAADNGVDIINMSIGGPPGCEIQEANLQSAIDGALSKGVVVIAAAGNDGVDAVNISPASCKGVITVGAIDRFDNRSIGWDSGQSSNWGSIVDISAPGTDILSTDLDDYSYKDGTSMAVPYVSGAVALLLSTAPDLSPEEVKDCLINNADPIFTDFPIGPRLNVARTIVNCSPLLVDNKSLPVASSAAESNFPFSSILNSTDTSQIIGPSDLLPVDSIEEENEAFYNCQFDPKCAQMKHNIQLCTLSCIPKTN